MTFTRSWWKRSSAIVALVVVGLMLATACGSSGSGGGGSGDAKALFSGNGVDIRPAPKTKGEPDSGFTPTMGGTVTMGLESEDSAGYCLAEAQLDNAGEQVARTMYDTLTYPGADGKYHPYLAKDVTHSADNKTWTITIRDGIKFSDGSPLTAQVVKDNLDAYRGKLATRKPLLFIFVFNNVDNVTVSGPDTVDVTMKAPWVDFDAQLFAQGRLGIMGEAQLKADAHTCATQPIGTGPFTLKEWVPNDHYTFVRNPNYWQKDSNGRQLPYLDQVIYKPIPDAQQRDNALQSGVINAESTSSGPSIANLRTKAANNQVRMITSVRYTEQAYWQLNTAQPPFNDENFRLAVASALNLQKANQLTGANISPLAKGGFSPGSIAYTDTGFPKYDPAKAKQLITQLKAEGKPTDVSIQVTPDTNVVKTAELAQEDLKAVGINATISKLEQSQLINSAINGSFQMMGFRNFGGITPDEQYVWWYGGGNPVNFSRTNDPVVDCLLDVGRSQADVKGCLKDPAVTQADPAVASLNPTDQKAIYLELNKWFAKKAYYIWGAYSAWTIATTPNIHGILGPKLPDGSAPWQALLNGAPTLGMWINK